MASEGGAPKRQLQVAAQAAPKRPRHDAFVSQSGTLLVGGNAYPLVDGSVDINRLGKFGFTDKNGGNLVRGLTLRRCTETNDEKEQFDIRKAADQAEFNEGAGNRDRDLLQDRVRFLPVEKTATVTTITLRADVPTVVQVPGDDTLLFVWLPDIESVATVQATVATSVQTETLEAHLPACAPPPVWRGDSPPEPGVTYMANADGTLVFIGYTNALGRYTLNTVNNGVPKSVTIGFPAAMAVVGGSVYVFEQNGFGTVFATDTLELRGRTACPTIGIEHPVVVAHTDDDQLAILSAHTLRWVQATQPAQLGRTRDFHVPADETATGLASVGPGVIVLATADPRGGGFLHTLSLEGIEYTITKSIRLEGRPGAVAATRDHVCVVIGDRVRVFDARTLRPTSNHTVGGRVFGVTACEDAMFVYSSRAAEEGNVEPEARVVEFPLERPQEPRAARRRPA